MIPEQESDQSYDIISVSLNGARWLLLEKQINTPRRILLGAFLSISEHFDPEPRLDPR